MRSRTNSQSPHPTFNMSMASVAQSFQNKNVMLGMRNINTKNSPNSNNNLGHDVCITKTWVTTCRQMLIDMESKNIKTRAVFWTQFVNDTTSKTMDKIAHVLSELNIEFSDCTKFLYVVDNPIKHLRFLAEWTGLKTQQMQYMPKSYTEFEYKAKNWLNGRKAPNYALTLFPEMIRHAESYAEITSNVLFKTNKQASNLLSTALRYGYLARLCSAKISLNDTGRKTPLLIENSIKTAKSTTSKIFQQYAIDHPYSSQFPSHTSEAATYFEGKHQECLQRLVMILKSNPNGNNTNNNNNNINNNNNNNTNALGPPTNIMPTIPSIPLPSVPIPQIPNIPSLSDGSSHASNDKMNADSLPTPTPNNNDNNNNNNFSFNILHNQQGFTVSEINNNNNNNVVSPGSTNSTFNSNNGQFGISSPSTSSNLTPNQSNYNSQNVLLPARQYNNLVAQLNRLTETQNTQKDTIHQLLTRLHTLEARIDNNHRLQQQQFLNTSQSLSNQSIQDRIQDQLWSNHLSNNTPSLGYSLAADFANATNSTNTPNLASINGALTHNKFPNNPATSIGSTQTPTTNSSDTPPVLNNFQFSSAFANAHSNNNNNNQNDDGDIDIQDNDNQNHHHNHNHSNHNHSNHNNNDNDNDDVNQSTIPFVGLSMFNDNHNDIHMFSANPNINTFPPFI